MKAKARKKAIRDDVTYMAPEEGLAMELWNVYYRCADMSDENDMSIIVALWKAENRRERDRWIKAANKALKVVGRNA